MYELHELLTQNNITQTSLACSMKVTQQTISNWCNKKSSPNPSQIKRLAEFLNTSSEQILNCFIREA